MTSQQEQQQPQLRRRRPRGVLAFIGEDVVQHYPYDCEAWDKQQDVEMPRHYFRKGQRRRRHRQEHDAAQPAALATQHRVTADLCRDFLVIVVFLFDPRHPHSWQVRNQLVRLTAAHSHEIHCLAACATSGTADADANIDAFLKNTGFSRIAVTSAIQTCFHWDRAPYLTVVGKHTTQSVSNNSSNNTTHYSRKVISSTHEELALKWNLSEVTVQRWKQNESGLTWMQQAAVMALYPSCAIL